MREQTSTVYAISEKPEIHHDDLLRAKDGEDIFETPVEAATAACHLATKLAGLNAYAGRAKVFTHKVTVTSNGCAFTVESSEVVGLDARY